MRLRLYKDKVCVQHAKDDAFMESIQRLYSEQTSATINLSTALLPKLIDFGIDSPRTLLLSLVAELRGNDSDEPITLKESRIWSHGICDSCKSSSRSSSIFNSRICFNALREVERNVVSGLDHLEYDVSSLLMRHPEMAPSLFWVKDLIGRQACMTLSRVHANSPYAESLPKDDYPKLNDSDISLRNKLEKIMIDKHSP